MSVTFKQNIYGLSKGIYNACLFLGLKFPATVPTELQTPEEHMPSDYFGTNFEFDIAMTDKLCSALKCSRETLYKTYRSFAEKFLAQKVLKRTKTDLNIYFCDYVLFTAKKSNSTLDDYFISIFYKNYGLSEGVFKACLFLGLKFPLVIPKELRAKQEHMPSDYFGTEVELDAATKKKLRAFREWSERSLEGTYSAFSKKFLSQKCLKYTKTDLNVYFCDYVLFAQKQTGAIAKNYFNFEFYNKSAALQSTFRMEGHRIKTRIICNDRSAMRLVDDKSKTNTLFAEFLHRDWIYPLKCTFEEFKAFVEKHPRFFSKPFQASGGKGAQITKINPNKNLKEPFEQFKRDNRILEEIITQHEALRAFCPDTVNTVRVNTLIDIHGVVHILATSGRFGRKGNVVDNFSSQGFSVIVNPETGIITSDGLSREHERIQKHPDTGKTLKGFQYPCWDKVRATVMKTARLIPQLRHVGWDITINDKSEVVLVEANGNPDVGIQQAPDSVGRRYLYDPFLEEIQNYKREQMMRLGYRVNNLEDFDSLYDPGSSRLEFRLRLAMEKLMPNCKSLLDLGCRKAKKAKNFCPEKVKYYPVDYKKYDDEVILCDFNKGEFPTIRVDTVFCAFTAEYVADLPQFLNNVCNAARNQVIMLCRPIDREFYDFYRWRTPFLTDFTEKFLIETMRQNHMFLNSLSSVPDNASIVIYDFRKTFLPIGS